MSPTPIPTPRELMLTKRGDEDETWVPLADYETLGRLLRDAERTNWDAGYDAATDDQENGTATQNPHGVLMAAPEPT